MKNQWPFWVLGAGLIGSVWIRPVLADAPCKHDMGGPQGEQWEHRKGFEELGLTDDQKNKLQTIRENERNAMKPLWRKARDLRDKLSDQVEDKASDSALQSTLADLKSNRKAMMRQMEKFQEDRDAVLTPTQQAKMMVSHGHHPMGHDGERGHEGHDEGRDGHGWEGQRSNRGSEGHADQMASPSSDGQPDVQ